MDMSPLNFITSTGKILMDDSNQPWIVSPQKNINRKPIEFPPKFKINYGSHKVSLTDYDFGKHGLLLVGAQTRNIVNTVATSTILLYLPAI